MPLRRTVLDQDFAAGCHRDLSAEIAALRPGTTICPGELARRLGKSQAELRPALAALAAHGEVRILQRGAEADLRTLRGPYRVGPART